MRRVAVNHRASLYCVGFEGLVGRVAAPSLHSGRTNALPEFATLDDRHLASKVESGRTCR